MFANGELTPYEKKKNKKNKHQTAWFHGGWWADYGPT
jgi:hypothetical protein